jgi:hypothetical protein
LTARLGEILYDESMNRVSKWSTFLLLVSLFLGAEASNSFGQEPAPLDAHPTLELRTSRPVMILYALESILGYPIRSPRLGQSLCSPFQARSVSSPRDITISYERFFANDCALLRRKGRELFSSIQDRLRRRVKTHKPGRAEPVNPEEVLEDLAARSKDIDEFFVRISGLLDREQLKDLRFMFRLIDVRLITQYDIERTASQNRIHQLFKAFLDKRNTDAFLERVARMLGARWPLLEPIRLVLIPIPNHKGSGASSYAHQSGQTVLVEILEDDNVEHRASVAVHEMIHVIWFSLEPEKRRALKESLIRAGKADGYLAWTLLNEGMATAIGNGIYPWSTSGTVPDGLWYADEVIDQFARVLAPILLESYKSRTSLGSDFADRIMRAFRERFPNAAQDPRFVFRELYLVIPSGLKQLQELTHSARQFLGTISMRVLGPPDEPAVRAQILESPQKTVLLFASPDNPGHLEPYIHLGLLEKLIGPLSEVKTPQIISCRNATNRWYTFVLARSPKERHEALFRLSTTKMLPLCDRIPDGS